MKSFSKELVKNMSETQKLEFLIEEFECIKEIANYHYKQNGGSRPMQSGTEACTWIVNEIDGIFKLFG